MHLKRMCFLYCSLECMIQINSVNLIMFKFPMFLLVSTLIILSYSLPYLGFCFLIIMKYLYLYREISFVLKFILSVINPFTPVLMVFYQLHCISFLCLNFQLICDSEIKLLLCQIAYSFIFTFLFNLTISAFPLECLVHLQSK